MKTAFAVGKCDRKTRSLVLLKVQSAPIVGPFTLKVVVTK
jgi:hypothetical protein